MTHHIPSNWEACLRAVRQSNEVANLGRIEVRELKIRIAGGKIGRIKCEGRVLLATLQRHVLRQAAMSTHCLDRHEGPRLRNQGT